MRRDNVARIHLNDAGAAVHGRADFAVGKVEPRLLHCRLVHLDCGPVADGGHAGLVILRGAGKASSGQLLRACQILFGLDQFGPVAFELREHLVQRDFRRPFVDDEKQIILFDMLAFPYQNFHQFSAHTGNERHCSRGFHRAYSVNGGGHVKQAGFGDGDQRRFGGALFLLLFSGAGRQAERTGEQGAEYGMTGHMHEKYP